MNSQRIHAVDVTARNLKVNARLSLKDQQLRNNMRSAMDSLISKRIISMPDEDERENLRELGNKIRARLIRTARFTGTAGSQSHPARCASALGQQHSRSQ